MKAPLVSTLLLLVLFEMPAAAGPATCPGAYALLPCRGVCDGPYFSGIYCNLDPTGMGTGSNTTLTAQFRMGTMVAGPNLCVWGVEDSGLSFCCDADDIGTTSPAYIEVFGADEPSYSDTIHLDGLTTMYAADVEGYSGNDTIYGTCDAATGDDITGGDGDDTIYGCDGDDTIDGAGDLDWIKGGNGVDELHGGDDNDHICGQGGNDSLYGEAGDDGLSGGTSDTDAIIDGGTGTNHCEPDHSVNCDPHYIYPAVCPW